MKKLTKSVLALLMAAVLLVAAVGCNSAPADQPNDNPTVTTTTTQNTVEPSVNLSVAAIAGPTGVGFAHMMDESYKSDKINYTFSVMSSPDEVVAKFSNGEVQIASVPTNLAAKLHKKLKGDVQMLAVNTMGVLYMLENGNTIQSVADLRGKTIYSTGEGANPEYVLRHILKKNGLDPDKDVKIEFLTENTELITKLATGAAKVAMVPEPAATTVLTKNANLRVALSMDAEWNKVEPNSGMLMGCVIAKKSFAEQNTATVDAFLKEYENSIIQATANIDQTAALCEKNGIITAAAIAKNAIPRCNVTYLYGEQMKQSISGYYQVLFEADPTSIGGAVPPDEFYYGVG